MKSPHEDGRRICLLDEEGWGWLRHSHHTGALGTMKMREARWRAAAKLPAWNPNQKAVAGAAALQGAFGTTLCRAGRECEGLFVGEGRVGAAGREAGVERR